MKASVKNIVILIASIAAIVIVVMLILNCDFLSKKYDNYILEYANSHTNTGAISPLEYYGYKYLSEQENSCSLLRAYNKIAEGVQSCETNIWLYNIWYPLTLKDLGLVYYCYRLDYPQAFWVESNYTYSAVGNCVLAIQYNYSFTKEQLPEAKEKFDSAVADIIKNTESLSNIEKEEYIYNYIVQNVHSKSESSIKSTHSAYGALINKDAVCEGQAELLLHLMREAGVPCMIVYGTAKGDYHAWNIVQIGNNYYNLDVTWDGYYTKKAGNISHRFYNMTSETMSQTHQLLQVAYEYPVCD